MAHHFLFKSRRRSSGTTSPLVERRASIWELFDGDDSPPVLESQVVTVRDPSETIDESTIVDMRSEAANDTAPTVDVRKTDHLTWACVDQDDRVSDPGAR